ncbi:MAG: bifunctional folylpolyglutamate synthase/dihydrofolate synthase [Pelagibacteraceae bacterium TMED268]|nr:MAG: bifunctional folylpolyglutamate synthase/dihydrofolate synthase [Pelagibacteraceae bacterium TMED268]
MKLQKILERLQKLHPKEIDLSLDRIKNLCEKLGNPQKNLNSISVVGTNGKNSTIQTMRAILSAAKIKCNIYTSPHVTKINERFIYNNKEINDDELYNVLCEVEEANNGDQITYFEILTAGFFHGTKKYKDNINIIESGLFHRFDATNILEENIASVVTAIGIDHTDWLPENERTIDKIIFEKTSSLLNSKIIVSNQDNKKTLEKIKKSIKSNNSKKIIFNELYSFSLEENNFFYYEDEYGGLKLPMPNLIGEFQLSNVATAIATLRNIEKLDISDDHIKEGILKIPSIARLQEIKLGKLKSIIKNNKLFVDGSHNALGAKVLTNYLDTINSNKHIVIGMMANKDHEKYIGFFKNKIKSITTVDIPNQTNAINGEKLKNKITGFNNVNYKKSILEALKSLELQEKDIVLITGSLYLAGEVLNLN